MNDLYAELKYVLQKHNYEIYSINFADRSDGMDEITILLREKEAKKPPDLSIHVSDGLATKDIHGG